MARPDFSLIWGSSRPSIPAISSGNYAAGWDAYLGPLPPLADDHDYVMNLQDKRAIWLDQNKANLESPNFTGAPSTPTAAQFDNDTSVANTAFVQRALGNYQGNFLASSTQTLTAAQSGMTISAENTITLTLPLGVDVAIGASYQINNAGAGAVTVQANAGNSLYSIGNQTPRTFVLRSGDYVTISYVGSNLWYAWGGVQLGSSASFGSSLTSPGFQKLPSGRLENWGLAVNMAAGETRVITLPSAFLVGAKIVILTGDGANPSARVAALGTNTISIQNTGTANQNVYWFTVGN